MKRGRSSSSSSRRLRLVAEVERDVDDLALGLAAIDERGLVGEEQRRLAVAERLRARARDEQLAHDGAQSDVEPAPGVQGIGMRSGHTSSSVALAAVRSGGRAPRRRGASARPTTSRGARRRAAGARASPLSARQRREARMIVRREEAHRGRAHVAAAQEIEAHQALERGRRRCVHVAYELGDRRVEPEVGRGVDDALGAPSPGVLRAPPRRARCPRARARGSDAGCAARARSAPRRSCRGVGPRAPRLAQYATASSTSACTSAFSRSRSGASVRFP